MLLYISNLLKSWGLNGVIANYLAVFTAMLAILFTSYLIHLIHKTFPAFFIYLKKIDNSKSKWIRYARKYNILKKLYLLGHILFISLLVNVVTLDNLPHTLWLVKTVYTILLLCIIAMAASLASSLLNVVNEVYKVSFEFAKQRPIKSYLDFLKILIWIIAIIIIISILTNKSPATMLAGLGAISACLLYTSPSPRDA